MFLKESSLATEQGDYWEFRASNEEISMGKA